MTPFPWDTIIPSVVGIGGVGATIYAAALSNRIKQTELSLAKTKEEFDRDVTRRNAIVDDINRCESRIDELQLLVKKWMADYDELHQRHLDECRQHNAVKLELLQCQSELQTAQRKLAEADSDREKLRAELSALEKVITRTMTKQAVTEVAPVLPERNSVPSESGKGMEPTNEC